MYLDSLSSLAYTLENTSFYASLRAKSTPQDQGFTLQSSSPNNVLDKNIEWRYKDSLIICKFRLKNNSKIFVIIIDPSNKEITEIYCTAFAMK